jgi:hypothetical protein
MLTNFLVVLFKNKLRQKIIKKFIGKDNCFKFYNNFISNQNIYFPVEFENGKECKFEIAVLELGGKLSSTIYRDEFGRNIDHKVEGTDYMIIKLQNFKYEERVYDIKNKKKLTFLEVINEFSKNKDLKSVFKINNKVVFQSDEIIKVYSCKTDFESKRFLNELQRYCLENKKTDYLISYSEDIAHKKELYRILTNKGFDIKMLYRRSTTHPKDK